MVGVENETWGNCPSALRTPPPKQVLVSSWEFLWNLRCGNTRCQYWEVQELHCLAFIGTWTTAVLVDDEVLWFSVFECLLWAEWAMWSVEDGWREGCWHGRWRWRNGWSQVHLSGIFDSYLMNKPDVSVPSIPLSGDVVDICIVEQRDKGQIPTGSIDNNFLSIHSYGNCLCFVHCRDTVSNMHGHYCDFWCIVCVQSSPNSYSWVMQMT